MNPSNSKTVVMYISPTVMTAAQTASGQIDTIGYDYLCVNISSMASSTATTHESVMELTENDTAMATTPANYTYIVALTGAAVTSTTAGFALPLASSVVSNNCRFNIDLKGRQRYIGVKWSPILASVGCITGTLFRCEDGPAAVATTSLTDATQDGQQRVVVSC